MRDLRAENEKLKSQLVEARAAIADRDAQIAKLAHDLELLQATVKQMLARRRGGYRVPEGQGLLFPDAALASDPPAGDDGEGDGDAGGDGQDEEEDDSRPRPRDSKSKRRTPTKIDTTGLRREERLHELPEHLRIDPVSGKPLVKTGVKVSEEIEYRRGEVLVLVHLQEIYGPSPEDAELRDVAPVMADLPPRPLEGCAASANLLAWLLVQKYGNHLPLYRQEAIFERDGLRLPRQTQCDWALASAELLVPIVDRLLANIRAGPVMQLDDTPVMCQGGRGETNFQAYLWVFANPEVSGVVYRFTAGRGSDSLALEIGSFRGTLVGDGYSGNRAAAKKALAANELEVGINLAGCWAHVTRKFRDAEKEAPGTAKLFRDDIRKLYDIEHEANEAELDPESRAELRRTRSKPILVAIYSRAWRLRAKFNEAGAMGKAIGYLRNQHRPLRRFLEDGRIPIDNNACERAIRPIAIGRRNWLFAGSMRGGRAAAVVYTLIECCRRAKVDPVRYFADVLIRVGTHPASRVEELLPEAWASKFARSAEPEPALV